MNYYDYYLNEGNPCNQTVDTEQEETLDRLGRCVIHDVASLKLAIIISDVYGKKWKAVNKELQEYLDLILIEDDLCYVPYLIEMADEVRTNFIKYNT